MSCRRARSTILELVRGTATEADRLFIESHLAHCEGCRVERAQWALMERLRDLPTRHLGSQARARVLKSLVAEAPRVAAAPAAAARSLPRPLWTVLGVAAAAALVLGGLQLAARLRSGAGPVADAADPAAYGRLVHGEHAGSLELPGARVFYRPGATVRLASARRVDLVEGEVEVDVKPGGPGRFRVHAPRFIVEVVGTRFVVRRDGMRTIHGSVRVLSLEGQELAVVRAGESWTAPPSLAAAPVGAAAPVAAAAVAVAPVATTAAAAPAAAAAVVAPPAHRASAVAPPRHAGPLSSGNAARRPSATAAAGAADDAARLLADAQHQLAAGRAAQARRALGAARALPLSDRQQAAADVLDAGSYLNEGRYREALFGYRRAADRWAGSAEGEEASFALAQVLWERGRRADARAELLAYLARYPSGRFHREVETHLDELRAAAAGPAAPGRKSGR